MERGLRGAIARLIKALQSPQETISRSTRYNLMVQLRSPHRSLAQEAMHRARENGWLTDGTLAEAELNGMAFARADFSHANLRGAQLCDSQLSGAQFMSANLSGADMRGVNLTGAHLQNADLNSAILESCFLMETDLRGTDLRKANLSGARMGNANLYGARLYDWQFITAETLCGAIMPDGTRYDGRYCLPGDLELASFLGLNLADPVAMADFYDVDAETFIAGQRWAAQYLDQLLADLDSKDAA